MFMAFRLCGVDSGLRPPRPLAEETSNVQIQRLIFSLYREGQVENMETFHPLVHLHLQAQFHLFPRPYGDTDGKRDTSTPHVVEGQPLARGGGTRHRNRRSAPLQRLHTLPGNGNGHGFRAHIAEAEGRAYPPARRDLP